MSSLFKDSGFSPDRRRDEAEDLLNRLEGFEGQMEPREQEFVEDLRERFQTSNNVKVSPKQIFWLRDIHNRYAL